MRITNAPVFACSAARLRVAHCRPSAPGPTPQVIQLLSRPARTMRSAGSVRGVRFGGLLVRPQAAAEDGRTNTIPAYHFVIVTSVVNPDDFAVDDPDDGVTVGTAAAGREASADNRERDLLCS